MTRLSINGKTKLYGIVGNPVSHSFSPEMQTLAFQYCNLNSVYLPFQIQENGLSQLLDSLDLIGVQGFNVTIPYKVKITEFLPELSEEAKFIGAVNTVKRIPGGWKGFCTDGIGFMRALKTQKIPIVNKKVLLIGAGGAAKAIAFSLSKSGVSRLDILNRTTQKAADLAAKLMSLNESLDIRINPSTSDKYDLLVNTTSVGMEDDKLAVAKDQICNSSTVVDIIYNPPLTSLLQIAKSAGIAYYNGIDMLLYQGVESFEIWTEKIAPVEIMRESLKNSLAFVK